MITWITDTLGRWATPDPEEEIWMVGHLIKNQDGLVLVDPPVVPGLPQLLTGMGLVRAIVLTTPDHTRGSRYLSEVLSCPIYAPGHADRDRLKVGRVESPEWYEDGMELPGHLRAQRAVVKLPNGRAYMDEMMLQRQDALLVGDLLAGNPDGSLAVCPEQFPGVSGVDEKTRAVAQAILEKVTSPPPLILTGHGWPYAGNGASRLRERMDR